MNKKIDIPVELYARLQELSHLARYEYTEQEGTWTIQNLSLIHISEPTRPY